MSARRTELLNISSESTSRGLYLDKLDAEDRAELEAFVAWFKTKTTDNTAASYKSHLAKAWSMPELKLTNDQKSALKKYAEFTKIS
jgi:hypothetical protein